MVQNLVDPMEHLTEYLMASMTEENLVRKTVSLKESMMVYPMGSRTEGSLADLKGIDSAVLLMIIKSN